MGMKKAVALLILSVVFIAGCIGGTTNTNTKTASTSAGSSGINFKSYAPGKVLASWYELFNETFYVSNGYEDLVKHYFPNASVKPSSEYPGSGILVLSPQDVYSKKILFGKPVQVQKLDFFGYIAYRNGMHYIGPWHGVVAIFNSKEGNPVMVVSGTSRAGVGAALNFLAGVKSGKVQLDRTAVVRSGNFEGMLVKEIGDTNLDGIAGEDEFVTLHQIIFDEPFQYYWRVVKGENITVSGGFIRMVNDTKVYIRALGFNVSVRVKNNKGITLTYVIDNINPNYVMAVSDQEDAMKEAIFGGTKVVVVSSGDFSIIPANVSNYTVLAFGDHRPGSGEKQPEVFFKIRDAINKENGAFVIDSGDLVYSGTIYQWEELMKAWKWNKPVFVAVGNHEYNGESVNIYHYYFGPTDYAFSLGGYRYIFANNVMNGYRLTDEQWAWLEKELERAKERGERPVIVMHAPPYDPRPSDEHTLDPSDAKKLLELMREYNAFGIFGHIHVYWYGTYEGVPFVITGGGGAPLYAKPEEGGFYHYVRLFMRDDGSIEVEPVEVSP
ncbi:metallophosphoesterase family protein [Thermococcus kodakarensis]